MIPAENMTEVRGLDLISSTFTDAAYSDYFRREDSRRRSYGNGLAEGSFTGPPWSRTILYLSFHDATGRPAFSPTQQNKNPADDLRSRQSSQSPAFSQREAHFERRQSTTSHLPPAETQPTSPPVRQINSLSVSFCAICSS